MATTNTVCGCSDFNKAICAKRGPERPPHFTSADEVLVWLSGFGGGPNQPTVEQVQEAIVFARADLRNRPHRPSSYTGLVCSFCGKSQREVKKLIAGPTVYICDECVGLCVDIIDGTGTRSDPETSAAVEVYRLLDWPALNLCAGRT